MEILDCSNCSNCSNCGQQLSEINVQLALEDIGNDVPLDAISFFCPSYDILSGVCQGGTEDTTMMAVWAYSL